MFPTQKLLTVEDNQKQLFPTGCPNLQGTETIVKVTNAVT